MMIEETIPIGTLATLRELEARKFLALDDVHTFVGEDGRTYCDVSVFIETDGLHLLRMLSAIFQATGRPKAPEPLRLKLPA